MLKYCMSLNSGLLEFHFEACGRFFLGKIRTCLHSISGCENLNCFTDSFFDELIMIISEPGPGLSWTGNPLIKNLVN